MDEGFYHLWTIHVLYCLLQNLGYNFRCRFWQRLLLQLFHLSMQKYTINTICTIYACRPKKHRKVCTVYACRLKLHREVCTVCACGNKLQCEVCTFRGRVLTPFRNFALSAFVVVTTFEKFSLIDPRILATVGILAQSY